MLEGLTETLPNEPAYHGNAVEQMLDAMAEYGIRITEPLRGDGLLHRYQHVDDRRGRRNVWAKLVMDERPAGMFGDLKRLGGEKIVWRDKSAQKMTAAERSA